MGFELGRPTKKDFIVISQQGNNVLLCCPCGSLTLAPPIPKTGTKCTGAEKGCERAYVNTEGGVLMFIHRTVEVEVTS